jgi:Uma2 family endonuclease
MATETLTNFTYTDLLEMPDDGRHYEILDGELIVNAAPNLRHQTIVFNIATILRSYVKPRRIGIVHIAPVDVVFTQKWVVEPDVVYVRKERESILMRGHINGAPDLAVEVLSDSTRKNDEITKRRAYENFGVPEYWIVDPELESVKIYRRNDAGRYDRVVEVSTETEGATISSPLFPDLEITLAEVFEE